RNLVNKRQNGLSLDFGQILDFFGNHFAGTHGKCYFGVGAKARHCPTASDCAHPQSQWDSATQPKARNELRWVMPTKIHFSQTTLISFSTALNSGSPVRSSEFFTFASAAAKQSA